jgi:hypothetical protein
MGDEFLALQWHGDTFDLPAGAVCLGQSPAYPHQAMRFGDAAYAVQFHVEVTDPMFAEWRRVPAYAASADAALGASGLDSLARAFAESRDAMAETADRLFHSWLRRTGIHCGETLLTGGNRLRLHRPNVPGPGARIPWSEAPADHRSPARGTPARAPAHPGPPAPFGSTERPTPDARPGRLHGVTGM